MCVYFVVDIDCIETIIGLYEWSFLRLSYFRIWWRQTTSYNVLEGVVFMIKVVLVHVIGAHYITRPTRSLQREVKQDRRDH